MNFKRLALTNVRCYESVDVELDPGVSVVYGPNGSGKTTLLEAAFFALYGARALDSTLDQFVTTGAEEATVTLWFTHAGSSYRVHRRIRVTDDRATTASCVLETDNKTIEGVRDVEDRIVSLLRMDADAFVNCAYVRQGEINKLIHATPQTRQAIIDDLLQLGVLEEYRDRAGEARLAIEDRRSELHGTITELETRIESKQEKDLHARLNKRETERNEITADIEHIDEQIETAETTREEAIELIEAYEQKQEELATLTEQISDLETKINETEQKRDELNETLREHRDRKADLETQQATLIEELTTGDTPIEITELTDKETEVTEAQITTVQQRAQAATETAQKHRHEHELAAQRLRDEAQTAADRIEELVAEKETTEQRIETLSSDLEAEQETLTEQKDKLAELEQQRQALNEDVETAPAAPDALEELVADRREQLEELTTTITDREAKLETVTEQLEDAKELRAAGRCPECGQPVDDAPHVDAISEYQQEQEELQAELQQLRAERDEAETALERAIDFEDTKATRDDLTDRIETSRQLLAEREDAIAEKRDRLAEQRSKREELTADIETNRQITASRRQLAAAHDEAIAQLADRIDQLNEVMTRLEKLRGIVETRAEIEEKRDTIRERRALLAEQNEERQETLAELKRERQEIETEYDEKHITQAKADKQRAEDYLSEARAKREELAERRDQLQGEIGAIRNELAELETLQERLAQLTDQQQALDHVHEEVTDLEEMYGDLRSDLRRRNVRILEELLNETFQLVYQGAVYDRIELSDTYELTVYQKDGEPLRPEQLSGGERALFNLSLRAGIYRLLAEGIDGTAPMPPLILDEPTVFLDATHVSRLIELIDAMRELGVEQILVVSHDEELIDAADDLISVRKDATTNRSSVTKRAASTVSQAD